MIDNLFKKFQSSLPWLEHRTIFLTKHGSHAYGTNTPESDLDLRGVCIPPREYFFGFHKKFEQAESRTEPDCTIFDIRKFFKLAANCNPNIIELLWVDEDDWYIPAKMHRDRDSLWMRIVRHREEFLSQRVSYTYRGYAMSQLKRIKTHRRWLINPTETKPLRGDYSLPETTLIPKDQLAAAQAAVKKKVDSWEIDLDQVDPDQRIYVLEKIEESLTELYADNALEGKERTAARLIGYDDNMIDVLHRERKYNHALKEYNNYQNWKTNRNPKRSELEKKYGYDSKHAMHLVRLLRQGREILEGGGVIVKRPDAEELLAIRDGIWSYDELVGWAEKEDDDILEMTKKSSLPRKPNMEDLNQLCMRICDDALSMGIS